MTLIETLIIFVIFLIILSTLLKIFVLFPLVWWGILLAGLVIGLFILLSFLGKFSFSFKIKL